VEIKFHHCTVLQKGEAFVYYNYNRELKGFFIASLVVANNLKARLNLAKLIVYFFKEIVRNKDVYCSLFNNSANAFTNHMVKSITKHSELNGLTIYKIEPKQGNS